MALLVAALVVGLPGLVGTLIGVTALREVRAVTNPRRGAVAAVLATLGWPLAVADLALGWALFGPSFALTMRLGTAIGLVAAGNLVVAIALLMVAAGLIDWLAISWLWRWVKRRAPLSRYSRMIRFAGAAAIICLGVFGAGTASLRKSPQPANGHSGSYFALRPDFTNGPASENHHNVLRWTLAMAPNQQATMSLNVFSNNLKVVGIPLTATLRTSGVKHLQGEFTVDIPRTNAGRANLPQWRALLVVEKDKPSVFEFRPPVPTTISWSPLEKIQPVLLGRHGSFDGAILKGLQPDENGQTGRPGHWFARLHVEVRPSS